MFQTNRCLQQPSLDYRVDTRNIFFSRAMAHHRFRVHKTFTTAILFSRHGTSPDRGVSSVFNIHDSVSGKKILIPYTLFHVFHRYVSIFNRLRGIIRECPSDMRQFVLGFVFVSRKTLKSYCEHFIRIGGRQNACVDVRTVNNVSGC